MSQNAFLNINAIISITFGALLIFVPAQLLSIFGVPLHASGVFVARLLGVGIMGIGFVCWSSEKSTDKLISDIIKGILIAGTIGLIILIMAQLNGTMNVLGWIIVTSWLILTLGLGYLRFLNAATQKI